MAEELSTREKLIIAGMDDIRFHGVQGFSLRRAAAACGVSCAAPYKHFADKYELFMAMIDYVGDQWASRLKEMSFKGMRPDEAIADSACEYLRFLNDNPHFHAMLLLNEALTEDANRARITNLSVPVKRAFVCYARDRGLTRQALRERVFTVRSLVLGAALIMSSDGPGVEPRLSTLRASVLKALE